MKWMLLAACLILALLIGYFASDSRSWTWPDYLFNLIIFSLMYLAGSLGGWLNTWIHR